MQRSIGMFRLRSSRLDDALVGLVRDDQVDIIQRQLGLARRLPGWPGHHPGGKAEYFAPVHLDIVLPLLDGIQS